MKKFFNFFENWKCILFLILLTIPFELQAQIFPPNLTNAQLKKLDQFVLDYIREMRVKDRQPQPEFIQKFNREYTGLCLDRAEKDFKKYGHWFYCVGLNGYPDEVVTFRVYAQLIHYYGNLEKVPGYTPEKRRNAIAFWQSWQNEDGSFKNPVFPGKKSNGKYVPSVLELLGGKPLYKTSGYGATKIDTEYFLHQCDSNHLNHAMARAAVMFTRIHEGETAYIPVLERGIELALTHMCPETGMFQGVNCDPSRGEAWSDYGATVETMKGLARLIGYMGTENIPFRHVRADNLIRNQKFFRKGEVSVIRNTAEMYMHCLFESSYRQDDLLQAMAGNAQAMFSTANWRTSFESAGGDYVAYALTIFGPFLHWEGYENTTPRTPFYQGVAHDWRVVIGPFGRCANVIKKMPQEIFWNGQWSYDKYGLRARDDLHERKKVYDIIPASEEGWQRSKDAQGRTVLKRTFTLTEPLPEEPYLKIKWTGGDIEIYINGILTRKKLGGLNDYGAIYINPTVRKSLHPGRNTITIRQLQNTKEVLNVNVGLIDWH